MSQKVRKTLIMIVMAALIICLMAASLTYTFTYGRYAGGKFDEESPYDDLIEFVGAREYTVRSPEELIQAIEDGYSNIKIADDAEEPFVITEGVTDVTANLVLNLNGKVVVRNSRNPMLDVQTNVSVVLVYDSKNTGAFYNPVGSSLMASGGSLTVGSGGYESGPRAGEYNGTNSNHGTLGDSNTLVTLYARDNAQSGHPGLTTAFRASTKGYTHVKNVLLPTITPKIVEGETDDTSDIVYGNIYLDNGSTLNTNWLPADTFLLYTEEQGVLVIGKLNENGDVVLPNSDGYDDLSTPEQIFIQNGDEVEALSVACNVASCDFYYYYDTGDWIDADGVRHTKQDERPDEGFTPIYAVIYGYWDVKALASNENGTAVTLQGSGLIWPYAAVRMVEGEGIVRGGTFSNHFDAVNTYGIYAEGGTLSVSKNTTVDTTFTTGGEGVCIRVQSAEAEDKTTGGSLTISGGTYSSEIGNTIEMEGGNMTVTKGTFTKTGCKKGTGNKQLENQTAIISLMGGTLNVSGAQSGDVTMTAGAENSTLENVFGIRAAGGGTVTTKGVSFHIYGDYSAGVLSYDGKINLNNNTVINVTQSDEHTQDNKTLLTSSAVSSEASEGGDYPINMNGNVTITSNGLGITARGNINVQRDAIVEVETRRATGIYVNGGTFTVENDAQISVNSAVSDDYAWGLPPEGTGTSPNIYNGVYVQGGSLTSEGELNVTFTGVESDAFGDGDNSGLTAQTAYQDYIVKSYAVRVDGGVGTNVSVNEGTITNQIGGGLYVTGVAPATIYDLSDQTFDGLQNTADYTLVELKNVTIQAQGCDPNGFTKEYINGFNSNWNYKFNTHGGHAVEVDGGIVGIKDGTYSAAQGDGIRVQDGMVFLEGGSFTGRDQYNNNEGGLMPGAAASYAFKVYGGSVKVTGGTFGSQSVAGSGAFVMEGTAYITKATVQAGGTTGFSAWTGATVTFAPANDDDIQVTADSTGLAVENGGTYEELSVTISGGNFTGGSDGIWYGNGNAVLTITGGTFQGDNRSGLFFGAEPSENNVQLSGGTYTGERSEQEDWRVVGENRTWYNNGAIGSNVWVEYDWVYYRVGVGHDLIINRIIQSGYSVYDGNGGLLSSGNVETRLCDSVLSSNNTIVIQ